MAFVQLFFNIFPMLTVHATATGAATGGGSERTGKKAYLKRRQLNVAQPDYRDNNFPGVCIDEVQPWIGDEKPSHPAFETGDWTQQHPGDVPATVPDYEEQLQFYGKMRQLLDLPILFAICFVQLISFVLVLNIEECSPLVLFSWWRNKIS
ncbi:uncharacterized protein LOC131211542 [Anopheles bellator]|uniref:uncharacterized protein LOC131211542 n=1 Tax=Anopheles bellator TaxID=139047 RepID=UPI002648719A|nr:uncharacterized protein LOC131211542 [Anopheles bellator]